MSLKIERLEVGDFQGIALSVCSTLAWIRNSSSVIKHTVASHRVTIIITKIREEDVVVVRKEDMEPASAGKEDMQAGGKTTVRRSGTGGVDRNDRSEMCHK